MPPEENEAPHLNRVVPSDKNTLRVGVDVSWNAYRRVERARSLLLTLLADTRGWSRSGAATGWLRETEHPDRLGIYLQLQQEAPLYEWSMRAGEAVHHLRAALDALAWDVAHLNGVTPSNPKLIDFPACFTAEAWTRVTTKRGWLSTVPQDIVRRVYATQPIAEPGGVVAQIHSLDIVDKHRGLLTGAGSIAGFRLSNVVLAGLDPATFAYELQLPESPPVLADGVFLGELMLNQHLARGGLIEKGPLVVEIDFFLGDSGTGRRLYDLAHNIADETLHVINFLCTGYDELNGKRQNARPFTI